MVYRVWHWLQSWQLKKHNRFWLQLFLLSSLGHLILLVIVFFWRKQANLKLVVSARLRPDVQVVFLPAYKQILKSQDQLAHKKTAIKPVENKKEISKKVPKQLPKSKKTEAPKKTEVKKPQSKKTLKKTQAKPKTKLAPKMPAVLPAPVVPEPVIKLPEQTEPIYLGRNDLKDLQVMSEIEQALVQNWQPPVGFGAQVECVVDLIVGPDGEITSLVIKKSSNILAYDLAVKRNFFGLTLPKSASNKTLTVVFRP